MLSNMLGRETFAASAPLLGNHFDIPEDSLSRAELVRIMGDHLRYLTGRRGKRATLRAAKLDGMALANVDLSEADLTGASMVGADLSGAILTRAGLHGADLRGSNLRGARLDFTDLRGASFRGANLANAVLDNSDLRPTHPLGDKLLSKPQNGVRYGAADFTNATLRSASFRNARLNDADFTDAFLEGAVFQGASLGNPCLRGAILTGVNLPELGLPAKAFRDALTAPTPAARARAEFLFTVLKSHHDWFISGGKRGRPANIEGEDLRPLMDQLKGLCLAGLSARKIVAVGVDFSNCRLQAAKFDGADLRCTSFAYADLSGCSFQRAKLAHASFRGACIQDLTLVNGDILPFQADAMQGELRIAA